MAFNNEKINNIYDKTDGCCHLCGKKHSFSSYGINWEVEHSVPKLFGGTDHLNNLFVGCKSCNRSKQAYSTKSTRRLNGMKKAPLSRKKKQEQTENRILGVALLLLAAIIIFIPKNNNSSLIKPNQF